MVPDYGEKSEFQVSKNELKVNLAPSDAYVFEIDTPNIERIIFIKEKIANNFKKQYPNKKIKSLKHEITWMIPNKVSQVENAYIVRFHP